jgi:hypothetical protein
MIEIRVRTGSMPPSDLVSPNAIIPALKVNGKKQALQEIAVKAAALTGQSERTILEILLQREKLGRDPEVARKLRNSHDVDALYAVLAMPSASAA